MASFNLLSVVIIAAVFAFLIFIAYRIAAGRGGPGSPTREIRDSGTDTTLGGDSDRDSGRGSGGRAGGSWDDGPSSSGDSSSDSSSDSSND